MPDIFDASKKRQLEEKDDQYQFEIDQYEDPDPEHMGMPETKEGPIVEAELALADEPTPKKPTRSEDCPTRPVEEYSEVMRKEQPSRNPLDAFAPKPLSVFFDAQDKAEEVLLLLRKHPITQIPWIVIALVMIFLPLLFGSIGLLSFLPGRFQIGALLLWYLLITGFMLESFLTWFFNVYIVTDERIIDVDFLSLIYKNITAAKIDNIEDVTIETGGAIRSVFNFGTVKIQTAGTNAEIEFEDVPQPAKVTRLLNELLLEEERERIEGRVN